MGQFPFAGVQPHRYTTIDRIRAEGILVTTLSDADALTAIELASNLVDNITDQFFWPVRQTITMDGQGDRLAHHPKLLPILSVFTLALTDADAFGPFILSDREFVISPNRRLIKRKDLIGFTGRKKFFLRGEAAVRFPRGVANVELDAVFGWLERFKEVSTTTVGALSGTVTQVEVASTDGIFVNDVVFITDVDEDTFVAVVKEVDTTNKLLKWDSFEGLVNSVAAGATVTAFGRVPLLIERACLLLVGDFKDKLFGSAASRSTFAKNIISERTDNYSYRFASSTGGDLSKRTNSTGNLEVDNILGNFTAPQYVAFA